MREKTKKSLDDLPRVRMKTCPRCDVRQPSHNFSRSLYVGSVRFRYRGRARSLGAARVSYRDWCCPQCRYDIDYPKARKRE